MHIVLLEPEIPPNTGNVARLCAVTRSVLHLIEPLGFALDQKDLKRAGLDYWEHLEWRRWKNWDDFQRALPAGAGVWFVEEGGPRLYTEAAYKAGDFFIFGRETAGLPRELLERFKSHWVNIPMFNPATRSLNLSNAVAVVLYEALRQQDFQGAIRCGPVGGEVTRL